MVHGDNTSCQNENSTEASMPKLASPRYYGRTALFIYLPIATLLDIATCRDAEFCFGGNGQGVSEMMKSELHIPGASFMEYLPSNKLTYPLPRHIWRWFSFYISLHLPVAIYHEFKPSVCKYSSPTEHVGALRVKYFSKGMARPTRPDR